MKLTFTSVDDIDSHQDDFHQAITDYLRVRGWRQVYCGHVWFWEGEVDGKTCCVDTNTAIGIQRQKEEP